MMSSPALAVGYLVRCRIPRQDLEGMTPPNIAPRFKDGYVRLDLEDQDAILTWVDAVGEPKIVMDECHALQLGQQMAQVITRWLLAHNARYPVPTGALLYD